MASGSAARLRGGGCTVSKDPNNIVPGSTQASTQNLGTPQGKQVQASEANTARNRYNTIDSIEAFAAEGNVSFVYASYFLELAAQQGGRFPRRQEVPLHAAVSKAALKRMADEVRAWRKLLVEHKDKPWLAWAMLR